MSFVILPIIILAGIKNIFNSVALNSGKWQMHKTTNSLRVMTWNVHKFVNLEQQGTQQAKPRIQMLKAIAEYKPDVLCLQEYVNIENSLKRVSVKTELAALGYIYSFLSTDSVIVRTRQKSPVVVTMGAAIFSRIPFTDTVRTAIAPGGETENMVYADVMFNNRPVRIFTAHLKSYIYNDSGTDDDAEKPYKIAAVNKKMDVKTITSTEAEHVKQISVIRNTINNSPNPVIYCGDLNATPASYTYNKLKGNLQDAFLQKGRGFGVTFYKILHTLRIDVCLVDSKLHVTQCIVPQLYLSDHFPVVTDVSWK